MGRGGIQSNRFRSYFRPAGNSYHRGRSGAGGGWKKIFAFDSGTRGGRGCGSHFPAEGVKMGFRRGNFMGGISDFDATAAMIAMGLSDREAAVAVAKYRATLEQLITDLQNATAGDRKAWREQIQGDPLYTMTADQYANYVLSQQGQ